MATTKLYKVYYQKVFGAFQFKQPTLKDIPLHYTFLKDVKALDLERVFCKMQGEIWSPKGEARSLIRKLKLGHTSMSAGDIAYDTASNQYFWCAPEGWELITGTNPAVIAEKTACDVCEVPKEECSDCVHFNENGPGGNVFIPETGDLLSNLN